MKVVLQRVKTAAVTISGIEVGAIKHGWLVLLGIGLDDQSSQVTAMVDKIVGMRMFSDPDGKFNLSVQDVGGAVLVVSQFTLFADCSRGRRPSFTSAAKPEIAKGLYQEFIEICRNRGLTVATGEFGADMMVRLENDGPVTIVLDDQVSTGKE